MNISEQAQELNNTIKQNSEAAFSVLSEQGKAAFFPKQGIVAQAAEAKKTALNATTGQALEDSGEPMVLASISSQVSVDPKALMYAHSFGNDTLREKWDAEIRRKNPSLQGVFSKPMVTSGLTHGLWLAHKLFHNTQDEVVLPNMFWGNYKLTFNQPTITTSALFKQGFNFEGLEKTLLAKPGKKIVVLNFPHNPTGYSLTKREMQELVRVLIKVADQNPLVVICDDAYWGLTYEEDICRESPFAFLCNAHENLIAVKVDGITKEAFSWGLRVGFISIGYKGMGDKAGLAFEDKLGGLVRGSVSNVSNLSQHIYLKALESPTYEAEVDAKAAILKERYHQVKKILATHKYRDKFIALPFNSGYFMCVKLLRNDANEVRKKLLAEYSTGVISIGKDLIRIAFSGVPTSKIPQLFENLYKACS